MKIIFHKQFDKSFQVLRRQVKDKFYERLVIFEQNPFDLALHNHELQGSYAGKRSINITGDYRAIFMEKSSGTYEFIEFVAIGTHSQLYG